MDGYVRFGTVAESESQVVEMAFPRDDDNRMVLLRCLSEGLLEDSKPEVSPHSTHLNLLFPTPKILLSL